MISGKNLLPHPLKFSAVVQRGSGFLLVGGRTDDDDEKVDTIYEFEPEDESWKLLEVHLAKGRQIPGAILVKKGWVVS